MEAEFRRDLLKKRTNRAGEDWKHIRGLRSKTKLITLFVPSWGGRGGCSRGSVLGLHKTWPGADWSRDSFVVHLRIIKFWKPSFSSVPISSRIVHGFFIHLQLITFQSFIPSAIYIDVQDGTYLVFLYNDYSNDNKFKKCLLDLLFYIDPMMLTKTRCKLLF